MLPKFSLLLSCCSNTCARPMIMLMFSLHSASQADFRPSIVQTSASFTFQRWRSQCHMSKSGHGDISVLPSACCMLVLIRVSNLSSVCPLSSCP